MPDSPGLPMPRFLVLAGSFGAALACAAPPPAFTEEHAAAVRDGATVFLAEFRRLSTAAQWDSVGALRSDRVDFRFVESGELRYASAAAGGGVSLVAGPICVW